MTHRKSQKGLKKPTREEILTAVAQEIKKLAATTININSMLEKVRRAVRNSQLTVKTLQEKLECWMRKNWMKVIGDNFVITPPGLTQILRYASNTAPA